MTTDKVKAPTWFMVVAIILLIWDAIGVFSFVMTLMMTDEMIATLPPEQQEMYTSTPGWINVFYAVATIGALLGCIGLVMKKAWAKMLFIASLVGVIVQFGYSFLALDMLSVSGPTSVILPLVILLIGIYQIWLSSKGQKEGWLV